jgi:flagellar basal-body rod protein FlgC
MPDPLSVRGLFAGVDIASSAMSAERVRMLAATENLARANDSTPQADGLPYRRQRVVFQGVLNQAQEPTGQVKADVVEMAKYERRYDPSHPHADAQGLSLIHI